MGFGFDFLFTVFPFLFIIMFVVILSVMITVLVRSAKTWSRNNNSPVLTVEALVASKRLAVDGHHDGAVETARHHDHTRTTYYTTFQVESGDRLELSLGGQDYGMLAEGDRGRLTFQGTRFLGFERSR